LKDVDTTPYGAREATKENENSPPRERSKKRSILGETNTNALILEEKKEKTLIKNIVLDRQIRDLNNKIFSASPLCAAKRNKENGVSPTIPKFNSKSASMAVADILSSIVKVDTEMFKYR
jgi:hypothetical protein